MVRAEPTNNHTAGIGPNHSTTFTFLLELNVICEQKWIQFDLQIVPGDFINTKKAFKKTIHFYFETFRIILNPSSVKKTVDGFHPSSVFHPWISWMMDFIHGFHTWDFINTKKAFKKLYIFIMRLFIYFLFIYRDLFPVTFLNLEQCLEQCFVWEYPAHYQWAQSLQIYPILSFAAVFKQAGLYQKCFA